jgi:predicted DNA-binding protein
MEDINIKSVRFPPDTDNKLELLAAKLGRPKRLVIIQMVDYFYKSKKDPLDLSDELLKKELVNGNNRIIGFIKRQESDLLLPTFAAGETLTIIAKEHTKYLKALSVHLIEEGKKTGQLFLRMGLLEKGIGKTQNHLDDKAQLKSKFKKIIEYYISQRESLGWPVSAVKKEELQVHVRQSLENL